MSTLRNSIHGSEMVDIHCHLLYGVDDGATSFKVSSIMLDEAAAQGITDIILTPHYRKGMFPYNNENIANNYETIKKVADSNGIKLYLGCEYHADSDMIQYLQAGRVRTLAGTDYVLVEYSHDSTYLQVRNSLEELISNGYIPVIAHAERYRIIQKDPGTAGQFREMGAKIQLNADSILGIDGSLPRRVCKRLLKNSLADIVASDSHGTLSRKCNISECRKYITKKYGEYYAEKLFVLNPGKIIAVRSGN